MNSILSNFTPDISFWEANPMVNTIPEFTALKKKIGEKKSSKIMWAISFLYDKSKDNIWRNVEYNDAIDIIKDEYLNDLNFNIADYEDQINAFKRHLMTIAQKSLLSWENKLIERDDLIANTPYNLINAKQLDDLQINTIKIFELYKKIKEDLEKEDGEGRVVGNKQESATEQGII